MAQRIIAPAGEEPSVKCHPLVAVAKPTGGVRITVDLSKLNSQVTRPAHPATTPYSAIRNIDTKAQYSSPFDALCGYWQVPLHEDYQHLTTFISPYGRFKFLRAPMGFTCTGDIYTLRGEALSGIQQLVKVVYDILVWDEDYPAHLQRVTDVLMRCRRYGITLNAQKFEFAVPKTFFLWFHCVKKWFCSRSGEGSSNC